MKITKADVKKTANRFLAFFEEQRVTNVSDLMEKIGKRFPLELPDVIEIEMRPSNLGTQALTVGYTAPYLQGSALELKINTALAYSQIILKADEPLAGYKVFTLDPWQNIVQYRVLETTELKEMFKELQQLKELR